MKRIKRNAVWILGLMLVASLLFETRAFALSTLAGGLLALLNFNWLSRTVDQLLAPVQGELQAPRSKAVLVYSGARVLLIFGTLFAMIQLSFFRPLGAVCGLSIFVLSGMLEAAILAVEKKV